MKVSVATISFNQAQFLPRCLESVLRQDYADLEYIVVDPGSTDGSRKIIERYRDHLARIVFEPDDGPADGLNKALKLATGDLFAWINSDDALLPGAIAAAARAFMADPDADAVYGQGYIVDANGRIVRHFRSHAFDARRYLYGGVNVMQQATFVRRQALLDVGGFNAANRTCWDAELFVDLALAGKRMRCVRGYWGAFRVHESSITTSIWSGETAAAYVDDTSRLLERVIGRRPRRSDVVATTSARVGKWVRDPVGTALRIFAAALPRRRVVI